MPVPSQQRAQAWMFCAQEFVGKGFKLEGGESGTGSSQLFTNIVMRLIDLRRELVWYVSRHIVCAGTSNDIPAP
jgi:hypothetical protein